VAKRKGTLSPDREMQLQALVDEGKLSWTEDAATAQPDDADAQWNANYDALVEYGNEHGHCNVTPSIKGKHSPLAGFIGRTADLFSCSNMKGLGSWLGQQRVLHRKNLLSVDREAKLQALVDEGKLMWDIASYDAARWAAHYADLVAFGEENGHCNVPTVRGDSGKSIK
jgi:hypothetical protein